MDRGRFGRGAADRRLNRRIAGEIRGSATMQPSPALPPLRLRPNTTNNERRLTQPRLVIAAAGNTIDAVHKRTALRDLRTWSLEPSGRAQIFREQEIWSKVVKGARSSQPEGVRIEALGVMKNVSLDAGGPGSNGAGSIRRCMWGDERTTRATLAEAIAPDAPVRVREMGMGVLANLVADATIRLEFIRDRDCMTWVVDAARPSGGKDGVPQNSQSLRKQALRVLRSLSLDRGLQRQMYEDKKGCREVVFAGAMRRGDSSEAATAPAGKTRQMIEVGVREQSLGVICNMANSLARELWKSRRVRKAVTSSADPSQLTAIREVALRCLVNLAAEPLLRRAMWGDQDVRGQLLGAAGFPDHRPRPAVLKRQALSALCNLASGGENQENKAEMWADALGVREVLLRGSARDQPEDVRVQSFSAIANLSSNASLREEIWAHERVRGLLLEGAAPDNPRGSKLVETAALRALANLGEVAGAGFRWMWAVSPTSPRATGF